MKKFPFYKQHDYMDCGPTCIRMVAKYQGKALNIETLRLNAQISKEGVSLLGIAEPAEKVGFNTQGVSLTYEELIKDTEYTFILTVIVKKYHFQGIVKYYPTEFGFDTK